MSPSATAGGGNGGSAGCGANLASRQDAGAALLAALLGACLALWLIALLATHDARGRGGGVSSAVRDNLGLRLPIRLASFYQDRALVGAPCRQRGAPAAGAGRLYRLCPRRRAGVARHALLLGGAGVRSRCR
ncbi:hypothetical protein ACU4GD_03595 [Cupriavidus basilensis]